MPPPDNTPGSTLDNAPACLFRRRTIHLNAPCNNSSQNSFSCLSLYTLLLGLLSPQPHRIITLIFLPLYEDSYDTHLIYLIPFSYHIIRTHARMRSALHNIFPIPILRVMVHPCLFYAFIDTSIVSPQPPIPPYSVLLTFFFLLDQIAYN